MKWTLLLVCFSSSSFFSRRSFTVHVCVKGKKASLSLHKMRTRKMNMRLRTTFTPRLLFYHLRGRERKTKGQVGNERIEKLSTTSRCSHLHSYVNFTCYSTRRARWKVIMKQALVNVLEICNWMELVLFPFSSRFVSFGIRSKWRIPPRKTKN